MVNMETHPNHISQGLIKLIKNWEKTNPETLRGVFKVQKREGFPLLKPLEERLKVTKPVRSVSRKITEEDIKKAIFMVKNGFAPEQKALFVDKTPSMMYKG